MILKAEVELEIEACDFRQAADHQRMIEHLVADLRVQYPHAQLTIRNRRARRSRT